MSQPERGRPVSAQLTTRRPSRILEVAKGPCVQLQRETDMKKLLAVALVALFTAAVFSPAAFAECASKSHSGTKTADQAPPKTTST
jgi:hypothetical protein